LLIMVRFRRKTRLAETDIRLGWRRGEAATYRATLGHIVIAAVRQTIPSAGECGVKDQVSRSGSDLRSTAGGR